MHIFLIEDNEGDIILAKEALDNSKEKHELTIVKNGQDAIDLLDGMQAKPAVHLPQLVLLDVNLPKKNGHQVLAYIKNNIALKHIPVVMLSTSESEKDIRSAYHNCVNCYVVKPIDAPSYEAVINGIVRFWSTLAQLPYNA